MYTAPSTKDEISHFFPYAIQVKVAQSGQQHANFVLTKKFFIHSFSQSWFVKISLRRRQALMVEDGAFSHKIDQVKIFWEILNPEGHPNYITGNFAEWVDFAFGGASVVKGLRLQPAQLACFSSIWLPCIYFDQIILTRPGVAYLSIYLSICI